MYDLNGFTSKDATTLCWKNSLVSLIVNVEKATINHAMASLFARLSIATATTTWTSIIFLVRFSSLFFRLSSLIVSITALSRAFFFMIAK